MFFIVYSTRHSADTVGGPYRWNHHGRGKSHYPVLVMMTVYSLILIKCPLRFSHLQSFLFYTIEKLLDKLFFRRRKILAVPVAEDQFFFYFNPKCEIQISSELRLQIAQTQRW